MKKISKVALSSLVLGLAFNVNALEVSKPYVGIDFMNAGSGFKSQHGKESFKKPDLAYNLYGGVNLTDVFGIEAGFEKHNSKKGLNQVGAGTNIPARAEVPQFDSEGVFSSSHSYHPYVGAKASYDLFDDMVQVSGVVGFSVSKMKLGYNVVSDAGGAFDDEDMAGSRRDFRSTKVLPMLRVAASTKVMDNLSVRASLSWRGMSSIKANSTQTSAFNELKMKDQYSFGLGVAYHI